MVTFKGNFLSEDNIVIWILLTFMSSSKQVFLDFFFLLFDQSSWFSTENNLFEAWKQQFCAEVWGSIWEDLSYRVLLKNLNFEFSWEFTVVIWNIFLQSLTKDRSTSTCCVLSVFPFFWHEKISLSGSTVDKNLTKTVNYPVQFHADFLSSLCYDALLLRLALSHIAFLNWLKYRSEKRYHV